MNEKIEYLKVSDIIPTADNPRNINTKSPGFVELVTSIKGAGVKVPVHVRIHPSKKGKYDLRCGERRVRAAKLAKLDTIPAIVYAKMTDEEAFDLTFIENFARDDLSPLEEGKAVAILMNKHNGDLSAVTAKLGRSARWVRLRQNLHTNLSKNWTKEIAKKDKGKVGDWTVGHYELIARLPAEVQNKLLADWCKWEVESMTVAKLQGSIDSKLRLLAKSPFKIDDAELVPKAGACCKCNKRSSCEPHLWDVNDDINKTDKCLDPVCWNKKKAAYLIQRKNLLKTKYTDLVFINTEYYSNREIKAAEEALKINSLNSHGYNTCKKADKRAVPAMQVNGNGAGQLRWIKTISNTSSSCKKGGTKTLKQKHDELNRKRWFSVLRQIQEHIDKISYEDIKYYSNKLHILAVLIMEFGTSHRHEKSPWKLTASIMKKTGGADVGVILKSLWNMVAPKLLDDIRWNGGVTQVPDTYIHKAKAAIKMFGLNGKVLWKQACEDHKTPKSWAKEKTSVTNKKSKKK